MLQNANNRPQCLQVVQMAYKVTEDALDMKHELSVNLALLDPPKFVEVLRPAFKEDEIKLIVIGGILGAIVGVV